ncbi:dihydrofolate reductase family protein [Erysipelotrichaceae bacterium HCN-30851]
MRKVILYISMSLDGYIADKNGSVDWLQGQDSHVETKDTYSIFIKDVDTVIMGWNTYSQIIHELSPDKWVYDNLTSYVLTHRNIQSKEKIIFMNDNPWHLVKKLQEKAGKDIWICGGANIIQPLIKENMIDEYHIAIIPTLLGSGIRLFESMPKEIPLRLKHKQIYNGITELTYTRR